MAPTRVRTRSAPALPPRLIPRKKPRQARSRELVDAIVIAASRVLAESGWEGFAMKDVAKRAGVSSGSLYQYFPDRASLVAEIVERLSEREVAFQTERAAALVHDATLEQMLEATIRNTLAFQTREGPLMREALRAIPHLGRHALLTERVETMVAVLRAWMTVRLPDVPARVLDVTLHVLANAIHSLTHDGVLARPDWMDDETLATALTRLVRGYLSER
jgi:AcrR family transcriptional regulator